MVANVSSTKPNPKASSPSKPKRAPLLPSDNNAPPLPRPPKTRDVSSRYLSSSATSSSSFSSSDSMCARTLVNSRRAQSTELRRSVTPRIGEMLKETQVRRLSDSFALPVGKAVTGFNNVTRYGTPERTVAPVSKSGNADVKAVDQKRWLGRSLQESFVTTDDDMKLSGSGTATAVRALENYVISETKLKPNNLETSRTADKFCSDTDNSDRAVSDAESVSSGSTMGGIRGAKPRALMVPARFRQESVDRLRRVKSEPVLPPLSQDSKLASVNRYGLLSSESSTSRGMLHSIRAWSGIGPNSNAGNTLSFLSFAAESRRRKVGDDAIVDAHALRLLQNKYLQWRFVNAKADASMLVQQETAKKSLYNSCVTVSKLRQSVLSKQIEMQQLRQNLKLYTVLKNQMPYVKVWDQVERDHIVSLSETIASLESSTLRLPLVDGAKANVQCLKDAVRSAAEVTRAMTSLISSLVIKVEQLNIFASELANTTRNECCMIDQCEELLSILTHMEVQDCSLRAHILQLEHQPPTTITEL